MSRTEEHLSRIGSTLSQNLGGGGVREALPVRNLPVPEGGIPVAIPVADPDEQRQRARGFWLLRVEDIEPDPLQPRADFDDDSLERLGQDIAKRGLLQPIRVRKGREGKYTIIAGERRWRSAKMAKVKELPCQVIEQTMSDAAVLEEQLIENIHREELSEVEKAQGYQHLIHKNGWTQGALAQELNLSMASVSRTLKLLELPGEVRQHVADGRLPASTAYEIARIQNPERQKQLAEQAVTSGLSRDDVAASVQAQAGRREHKSTRTGNRLMCRLPDGTSITLSHSTQALTADHVIEALALVLGKARKLRSKSLPIDQLPGLLKTAGKDKNDETLAAEIALPLNTA